MRCMVTVCFVSIQGLKKPYNPILGETFRCMWIHPRTNSKTFYIAEQVAAITSMNIFKKNKCAKFLCVC